MLELEGLSRSYGDLVALKDLGLEVPRGQIVGFVGPNGAGKTTAMRIALGVLEPSAGEVRWDGEPLGSSVRRRFGYMPEERGLYPKMRAADHLAYLARLHGVEAGAAREAADRWLERMGLAERAGDRIEALSLGNRQRVQLAAALVHDPEALILDEPFSGLDPIGVEVMSGVLAERAGADVAILFSSHQLELVERLCDAVAIVNRGELVARGSVEELRRAGPSGRRIRVEVAGAQEGWARPVPGVGAVEADGDAVILTLEEGADDQAVLEAARAAGPVRHFGREEVTLSDLFREAVAP